MLLRLHESSRGQGWENPEVTTKFPSNAHCDIALRAAENGKHIFCEKPLAITLADGRRMLEAAEKNGIKHQIGFNYRFAPAVQLAKKLIDDGKIGTIRHGYRECSLRRGAGGRRVRVCGGIRERRIGNLGYEHTFVHEMYEFVQSIARDTATSPSFMDGVKCSQILEAVELFAARRAMVDVNSL